MNKDVAIYNLNLGLTTMASKLTGTELDLWKSTTGDTLQSNALKDLFPMFEKYPRPPITPEMTITPMIVMFLAIAKRGSIVSGWINKHSSALNTEHKFIVTDLIPENIAEMWASMKSSSSDSNVENIIKYWANTLSGNSIRFRITLQHAVWSCLSSLDAIHNALGAAPSFPWVKLYSVIPGDFENVRRAFMAVGANRYVGYRSSKGLASSRLYKSLAWACSRILAFANTSLALTNYAGSNNSRAQHDLLMEIINAR